MLAAELADTADIMSAPHALMLAPPASVEGGTPSSAAGEGIAAAASTCSMGRPAEERSAAARGCKRHPAPARRRASTSYSYLEDLEDSYRRCFLARRGEWYEYIVQRFLLGRVQLYYVR
jgi:hypothetical protein